MNKKINTDALIQLIILILTVVLLSYALITKKINAYVHPRYYLGLWLSIIILVFFALSLIPKIKKARHNVSISPYLIFIIPLAAALFFPSGEVISKDVTMIESSLSTTTSEQPIAENKPTTTDTIEEQSDSNEDASEKYEHYKVDDVVQINDDVFSAWFFDTYAHLDDFTGKRYQYLAQVFSMDDFKDNQFLAGRNFMVCCAADLAGYGIICESNLRNELVDQEWIMVTGTITSYQYNGHPVPMLTDVTITKTEVPEVGYIYYKNY